VTTGARVIQVRNPKDGVVRERALRLDEFAVPFTIGAEGDLKLEDEACLPVEAKAYFDGSTLFVASADPTRLVIVNKMLVGRVWLAVPCPSILEIGSSRLIYDDAHDLGPANDRSAVRALRWQVKAPELATLGEERASQNPVLTLVAPRPSRAREVQGLDTNTNTNTSTKAAWDSATQAFDWSSLRPNLRVGPPSEPVFGADARPVSPAAAAPHLEPPIAAARPARPALSQRAYERVRQEFVRTPRSMRLAFFSLPVLAMFVLSQRSDQARASSNGAAASATAALAPSAPASSPVLARREPESALVTRSAAAAAENSLTSKPSQQRSLEARAADAAARGALSDAITLYDSLTSQYPERSEFRSARRILAARASAQAERRTD
jgi:hypothetical protein